MADLENLDLGINLAEKQNSFSLKLKKWEEQGLNIKLKVTPPQNAKFNFADYNSPISRRIAQIEDRGVSSKTKQKKSKSHEEEKDSNSKGKEKKSSPKKPKKPELSEFEKALKSKIESLNAGLSTIGGTAGKVGSVLPKLLMHPLALGITAVVGGIGALALKGREVDETYKKIGGNIQKSFSISSTTAKNLAKDIAHIGSSAGLSSEEANELSLTLAKTGVSSSLGETKEMLRRLGVATKGSSIEMQKLSTVFSTIESEGKVSSESLESMANILGKDFLNSLSKVSGIKDPFKNIEHIKTSHIKDAIKSITGSSDELSKSFSALSQNGDNVEAKLSNAFSRMAHAIYEGSGIGKALDWLSSKLAGVLNSAVDASEKEKINNFFEKHKNSYNEFVLSFLKGTKQSTEAVEDLIKAESELVDLHEKLRKNTKISKDFRGYETGRSYINPETGLKDNKEEFRIKEHISNLTKKINLEKKSLKEVHKTLFSKHKGDSLSAIKEYNELNAPLKIKLGLEVSSDSKESTKTEIEALIETINTDLTKINIGGENVFDNAGFTSLNSKIKGLGVSFASLDFSTPEGLRESALIIDEMSLGLENEINTLKSKGASVDEINSLYEAQNRLKEKGNELTEQAAALELQKMKNIAEGINKGTSVISAAGQGLNAIQSFSKGDHLEGVKSLGSTVSDLGAVDPTGITKAVGAGITMITGVFQSISDWVNGPSIKAIENKLEEDLKNLNKSYEKQIKAMDASIKSLEEFCTTLDKENETLREAYSRGAISGQAIFEEELKNAAKKAGALSKIENIKEDKEKSAKTKTLQEARLKASAERDKATWYQGSRKSAAEEQIAKLEREMRDEGLSKYTEGNSFSSPKIPEILPPQSTKNTFSINIAGAEKDGKTLAKEMIAEINKLTSSKNFNIGVS